MGVTRISTIILCCSQILLAGTILGLSIEFTFHNDTTTSGFFNDTTTSGRYIGYEHRDLMAIPIAFSIVSLLVSIVGIIGLSIDTMAKMGAVILAIANIFLWVFWKFVFALFLNLHIVREQSPARDRPHYRYHDTKTNDNYPEHNKMVAIIVLAAVTSVLFFVSTILAIRLLVTKERKRSQGPSREKPAVVQITGDAAWTA